MDREDLVEALSLARTPAAQRSALTAAGELTWIDLACERPDADALLLLPGGMGAGEDMFPFFPGLRRRWRLLAPDMPADTASVADAIDGLAALLDAAGVEAAHVFGHSQGGYLAQAFARARPDRVRTLVLSATCPPSPAHARRIASPALLRLLPEAVIRTSAATALKGVLRPFLAEVGPGRAEFWSGRMTSGLERPGLKARALAAARLQLDFHRSGPWAPADEEAWRGRTAILWADKDELMSPADLQALERLYPQADVTRFEGAGHLSLMARVEAYSDAVARALGAPPDA